MIRPVISYHGRQLTIKLPDESPSESRDIFLFLADELQARVAHHSSDKESVEIVETISNGIARAILGDETHF